MLPCGLCIGIQQLVLLCPKDEIINSLTLCTDEFNYVMIDSVCYARPTHILWAPGPGSLNHASNHHPVCSASPMDIMRLAAIILLATTIKRSYKSVLVMEMSTCTCACFRIAGACGLVVTLSPPNYSIRACITVGHAALGERSRCSVGESNYGSLRLYSSWW